MSSTTATEKETAIRSARQRFVDVSLGRIDLAEMGDLVPNDIMGYGTTVDEVILNYADFRKLLEVQNKEMEQSKIQFDEKPVFEKIFNDGDSGIFVSELQVNISTPESALSYTVRLSILLNREAHGYSVLHWHGSTPVLSEEDTWHVKDHQGKTERLEQQVQERTRELHTAIEELKAAQEKLIVQEKLASLGQLAAGIAHEIKNPMNFVNNFSELSVEYVDELRTELAKLPKSETTSEMESLFDELESNLKKIHQHGTRADNIVKSMLMHSRGGTGLMEPTDLNALVSEYVNLAFHGMRAGKTAINAKINLDLDPHLPPVALNTEDFSRVVLNLCKNAFDAMREKTLKPETRDYLPELTVRTKHEGSAVLLTISDNGPGVPDSIKKKLFDPFFTTKKGTEGTGLGLSITHDIIKNHSGAIEVDSKPGEYTHFKLTLPIKQP